jgi:anti-anti-sigma regulatory factor
MMPSVHIDNVGEMAIIECAGRFVRSDAAFKLRDAVTSQTDARVVVLDLTEMHAIGGGGLGILVLLQRWAQDHDIRLKLFNPSRPVRDKLKHVDFEIATQSLVFSRTRIRECGRGKMPGQFVQPKEVVEPQTRN